jgi:hypothetical protein
MTYQTMSSELLIPSSTPHAGRFSKNAQYTCLYVTVHVVLNYCVFYLQVLDVKKTGMIKITVNVQYLK